MKKPLKKYLASAMCIGLLVPVLATAGDNAWWLVPVKQLNNQTWSTLQLDKLAAMSGYQVEKLAALASLKLQTLLSQDTATTQIAATSEKQTAALHELTQSEINYEATAYTARGVAQSGDKFSGQAGLASMCDTTGTTQYVALARSKSVISGKALGASLVRSDLSSPAEGVPQALAAKKHVDSYCSEEDKEHGRCDVVAPILEQNADLRASTLMLPSNGTTYTPKEATAAQDFIKILGNPMRSPDLPPAIENSPAGAAYLIAFRSAVAQTSVAYNSLSQIWAARVSDDSLSETVDASGDLDLSLIGVMRKFVYDRFVDPQWKTSLAGMDTNDTLREIAVMKAGKNFMTFQAYQQRQRMEALYATKLSIDAVDSNDARLQFLRGQLLSSK